MSEDGSPRFCLYPLFGGAFTSPLPKAPWGSGDQDPLNGREVNTTVFTVHNWVAVFCVNVHVFKYKTLEIVPSAHGLDPRQQYGPHDVVLQ